MAELYLVRATVRKMFGASGNTEQSSSYCSDPSNPPQERFRLVRADTAEEARLKFEADVRKADVPLRVEHSIRGLEVTAVIE